MAEHTPSFWEITKDKQELFQDDYEHWFNTVFLTFHWWILLVLLILPWFIWWKLVDKRKLPELSIYGLFVALTATLFDSIGNEVGLWGYPKSLIFLLPRAFPFDYGLLPVTYMLIYQYFPTWKAFLSALVIMSAFFSFIGEPFAEWLGMYHLFTWKHIYSFPIYILVGVILRLLTKKINNKC